MSENFPEYTREDWEALAVEATPDKKAKFLNEVINNEIEIKAVYSQEENNLYEHREMPGTAPYTRGTKFAARENGVWDIRAIVSSTDIESANKNALDELKKGSTSLLVDYENIGIRSFEDLETVLENIYLEMIGVCLKPGQN